eukprot:Filipodium_phascolosomae@DN6212_c0_g1_i1.p1
MYVFGGFDGSIIYNDLHELDTETFQWKNINLSTGVPDGRASHSACADDDLGMMYIFGGSGRNFGASNKNDLYQFDLLSQQWRCLDPGSEHSPSPR